MTTKLMAAVLGAMFVTGGATELRADDPKHQGAHGAHGTTGHAQMAGGKGSQQLHGHMKKASAEMRNMKMTGDVDHDFVMAMKRHHEHGVEMAQVVLREGKDPKAREMAQKMVSEQQKDIAELDAWLQQHKAEGKAAGTTTK